MFYTRTNCKRSKGEKEHNYYQYKTYNIVAERSIVFKEALFKNNTSTPKDIKIRGQKSNTLLTKGKLNTEAIK